MFRGRLVAPVTIWTSGTTGLTVSSLLVADGEPSGCLGLVGHNSDLADVLPESGRFVVHVLEHDHRDLADRFAGLRPAPGGLLRGLEIEESDWGPVLSVVPTRAYCRYEEAVETGYHLLVRGSIERVELGELRRPLAYFRGGYRELGAPR